MKKYIGILAKITGFILIVILAVNIILPLIKRNPDGTDYIYGRNDEGCRRKPGGKKECRADQMY